MDHALRVESAVSTVTTIKTFGGPGRALDRQRRLRPGAPTLPELAGLDAIGGTSPEAH
jgi:hypothetical protein